MHIGVYRVVPAVRPSRPIPSCRCPGTMPRPIARGRASACRPRPSGKRRRGDPTGDAIRGATPGTPPGRTVARRLGGQLRWEITPRARVHTGCRMWQETSGNGSLTGTPKITTSEDRPETPLARRRETSRVTRGGSWLDHPTTLRTTHRHPVGPAYSGNLIGFRCAKNP